MKTCTTGPAEIAAATDGRPTERSPGSPMPDCAFARAARTAFWTLWAVALASTAYGFAVEFFGLSVFGQGDPPKYQLGEEGGMVGIVSTKSKKGPWAVPACTVKLPFHTLPPVFTTEGAAPAMVMTGVWIVCARLSAAFARGSQRKGWSWDDDDRAVECPTVELGSFLPGRVCHTRPRHASGTRVVNQNQIPPHIACPIDTPKLRSKKYALRVSPGDSIDSGYRFKAFGKMRDGAAKPHLQCRRVPRDGIFVPHPA